MPSPIRSLATIFCDVGGVLVENPWIHTAEAIEAECGVPRKAAFDELTRLALELDRGGMTLTQYHASIMSSLGIDMRFATFESLVLDTALRRITPVWEAVAETRRSDRFHVVALSNMCREVWGALEHKYGIHSLFAAEVLSFEHGVTKPDPRIYRLALEQAAAAPESSLFIDDLEKNLEAAAKLGIMTYRAGSPEETALYIRSLGSGRASA